MKCEDVLKLLPLYQQGLLDSETAEGVSSHLDTCPACREALAAERRISGELDRFFNERLENPVSDLAEHVLSKTREDDLPRTGRPRLSFQKAVFRYGAMAAMLLLVLWVSFYFRHASPVERIPVQNAPVRIATLKRSPVRIPEIRKIHRKATVTRLKENVIWISYNN